MRHYTIWRFDASTGRYRLSLWGEHRSLVAARVSVPGQNRTSQYEAELPAIQLEWRSSMSAPDSEQRTSDAMRGVGPRISRLPNWAFILLLSVAVRTVLPAVWASTHPDFYRLGGEIGKVALSLLRTGQFAAGASGFCPPASPPAPFWPAFPGPGATTRPSTGSSSSAAISASNSASPITRAPMPISRLPMRARDAAPPQREPGAPRSWPGREHSSEKRSRCISMGKIWLPLGWQQILRSSRRWNSTPLPDAEAARSSQSGSPMQTGGTASRGPAPRKAMT